MVDGERKGRGLLELLQTAGLIVIGAREIGQAGSGIRMPDALQGIFKTVSVAMSGFKQIKCQIGTGRFGWGLNDESNYLKVRAGLVQKQPDGQQSAQAIDKWVTSLSPSARSKLVRVISDEFADRLLIDISADLTPLQPTPQASSQQTGAQPATQQQAPQQRQTQMTRPITLDEIDKSFLQAIEFAVGVLEQFALLPDDEARNRALEAAHLKRPELHLVEDEFGEEMLERAKQFSNSAWAKVKRHK